MDQENYDDEVSEMPEYSPKSEFSKPRLVDDAVRNCLTARSEEMKEGYYNTIIDKNGNVRKIWVNDTREKFISSVIALRTLLSPEVERDNKYQKVEKELYEELNRLFDEYAYEVKKAETTPEGVVIYKPTTKKVIPRIDAVVIIHHLDKRSNRIIGEEVIGGWNDKVNDYRDELVNVYDQMFSALNDLIDRNNYFKSSMSF